MDESKISWSKFICQNGTFNLKVRGSFSPLTYCKKEKKIKFMQNILPKQKLIYQLER